MKLSVLQIVLAAYGSIPRRARTFVLTAAPALCLVVALYSILFLDWGGLSALPNSVSRWAYTFYWVIEYLPYVLFALVWLRLHLLDASKGSWLGPSFIAYLLKGGMLLLLIWVPFLRVLPFSIALLLEAMRSRSLGSFNYQTELLAVALILLWTYLLTRVSLVIAASSVGDSLSLRAAWRATRGNGLRLLGAYLLAGLPLFILAFLVSVQLAPRAIFEESIESLVAARTSAGAILLVASASFVVVTAEAYRRLVGGPPSQDQVIMRFD